MKYEKAKSIEEIEERRRIRNKELAKRLEYLELKRGINKRKEDYEEQRWKKYVKNMNAYYEIFEPKKHVEITEGSRKEGRHTYPTKSKMDWDKENWTKYIVVKKKKVSKETGNIYTASYIYRLKIERTNPEFIALLEEEEKLKIPRRTEKVLLFINDIMIFKEIEIEPNEPTFYSNLEINGEEKQIYVMKFFPEENKIYKTIYGNMTGREIMLTALKTTVKIYGVVEGNVDEI